MHNLESSIELIDKVKKAQVSFFLGFVHYVLCMRNLDKFGLE